MIGEGLKGRGGVDLTSHKVFGLGLFYSDHLDGCSDNTVGDEGGGSQEETSPG